MERAPLDTDTLSEVLKAKNPVVVERATAYKTAFGHLTLSAITVAEIVKGLHKRDRAEALQKFVDSLKTSEVLVTGNSDHYRRIQALGYRLKLDNWR